MTNRMIWLITILMALVITACDVTETKDDSGIPPATEGLYVLCEGGFGHGNATIWYSDSMFESVYANVFSALTGDDLGDTGQSMYQHENMLYLVMNGSDKIEIIDFSGTSPAIAGSIELPGASPREMAIIGDLAYVSAWNLAGLAVVDLNTNTVVDTIPLGGLPEDVVVAGSTIYVAMTMDALWAANNKVMVVDAATNTVADTLIVGTGPNQLLLQGDLLYVSRQWYGDVSYRGISKVDLTSGTVTSQDWGAAGGTDIFSVGSGLFAATAEGVVSVNSDLTMGDASFAGSMPATYSAGTDGTHIIIGSITEYDLPGEIAVYSVDGSLVETFDVGIIPGSILSYTSD